MPDMRQQERAQFEELIPQIERLSVAFCSTSSGQKILTEFAISECAEWLRNGGSKAQLKRYVFFVMHARCKFSAGARR